MKKPAKTAKKAAKKTDNKKTLVPVKDAMPAIAKPAMNMAAKTSAKTAAMPAKPSPIVKKHVLYVEVTPDKYFVLCDGRKVKSGKELADMLQMINDDMFKYHVTDTKNDFSNWINDVFGEQDLAKKIRSVRNRLDMSIELYREMFNKIDKMSKAKK